MNEEIIASRYARALFDLAVEKDCVAEAADSLTAVAGAVVADRNAEKFWASPMVEAAKKQAALEDVIRRAGAGGFVETALRFLGEKERVGLLRYIARGFTRLADEHLKRSSVTVTTQAALPAESLESIRRILRGKTGKTIRLRNTVSPEMLGGMVVRIDNTIFNASVRGRLEWLRRELTR